jgi:hypothetical protein
MSEYEVGRRLDKLGYLERLYSSRNMPIDKRFVQMSFYYNMTAPQICTTNNYTNSIVQDTCGCVTVTHTPHRIVSVQKVLVISH